MSSTTISSDPATGTAAKVTTFLFALTVVFFLLAGLVTVVGQTALLGLGDATAARGWAEAMAPYAFGGASAAGLLSFVLSYWQGPGHGDDVADDD